jgi:hypothetical protein
VPPAAPPADDPLDRPAVLPDGSRRADGQVLRPDGQDLHGVPGMWVVLHRVGRDTAGPIDSVRTGSEGRYAFRYRPSGAGDALYFASTSYGGIAYFSTPFRDAVVTGDAAEITVFDTTTAPVPVSVRGRHLIVGAADPASGARNVIEVFEISNDSSLTALPRAGASDGVFSVALPPGAQGAAVRPGSDFGPEAVSFAGGRAVLRAPFAPGLRQMAYSYRVTDAAFPLTLPLERATAVLEVLVEDARGSATGGKLTQADNATVDGRTFRRFVAQDVPAGGPIRIELPPVPSSGSRWVLPGVLVVVGIGMAAAFVVVDRRRRRPRLAAVGVPGAGALRAAGPVPDARTQLLAALAALDDEFRARAAPTPDERARYEDERRALKERLAGLLAAEPVAR